MNMLIRRGVFETNSSSTHSITIAGRGELLDTLQCTEDGTVELWGGEFGWEQQTHRDALTKANYLSVYVRDWCGKRADEFKEILIGVIREHTGAWNVEFCQDEDTKYHKYGYIDHQSVDAQEYHYLFEDPELIRQFIFNPSSVLITDNDNH